MLLWSWLKKTLNLNTKANEEAAKLPQPAVLVRGNVPGNQGKGSVLPSAKPMKGIDVSSFQGLPDWTRVHSTGVEFVYIKASEGIGAPDKGFEARAAGANAVGLKTGFYHFATLNKPLAIEVDAKQEAVYFDSLIRTRQGALPPVLDIESNPGNLHPDQVLDYITTFINQMRSLGHPETVVYSYTPFLDEFLPVGHTLGVNKLWLAQYGGSTPHHIPKGWASYWMWQYTSKGLVDGISGNVDMNITA